MDQMTIFWIFVAVVMGVVEAATMTLVSIWFCIGAVAAAITSTFTDSVLTQCVVFVVVTAVTLAVTRPLAGRLTKCSFTPTNVDRVIGMDARVTQTIDPIAGTGQVSIGGQIWSARSEDSDVIAEQTLVTVVKISGVHAIVRTK